MVIDTKFATVSRCQLNMAKQVLESAACKDQEPFESYGKGTVEWSDREINSNLCFYIFHKEKKTQIKWSTRIYPFLRIQVDTLYSNN